MNINKLKFPIHFQKSKSLNQRTQQFSPYAKNTQRRHSQKGKQFLAPIQKSTHRDGGGGFRINKVLKCEGRSQQVEKSKSKERQYQGLHRTTNTTINYTQRLPSNSSQKVYQMKSPFNSNRHDKEPIELVLINKKRSSTNRMVTQKLKTKQHHYESQDNKYSSNGKSSDVQLLPFSKKSSLRKILPRQSAVIENSSKNIIRMGDKKSGILETSPEKYSSIQLRKTTKKVSIDKKLTPFQKEQSANYEIFYIGNRRIQGKSDYVDSEGDPIVMLGDSIAYKYEIVDSLGKGSFGKVFKAYDHKKSEYVALKIIKCQQKFTNQAKIEVQILENALLHDPKLRCNLVRMKNSFHFRGHACITFQILHKNLYEFLKQTNFSGFSLDLIRRFAIQILQTLLFFSHFKIIHCDLKPENILLKQQNKSGIKVIDVGSGCFQSKQLYTYIQSRFYRAPQIILGIKYTSAIDIWSLGCILIELYTGFPIFPGQNENQQMLMFMEILGEPPYSMLQISERRRKFFTQSFACKIPQEKGKERISKSVTFQEILGQCDEDFLGLIEKCLQWDPSKRITPKDALLHPWIINGLPASIRQQHIDQIKNYSIR